MERAKTQFTICTSTSLRVMFFPSALKIKLEISFDCRLNRPWRVVSQALTSNLSASQDHKSLSSGNNNFSQYLTSECEKRRHSFCSLSFLMTSLWWLVPPKTQQLVSRSLLSCHLQAHLGLTAWQGCLVGYNDFNNLLALTLWWLTN